MTGDAPAFFSYCREDSDFALKLAEELKAAGANVWIDQIDIEPGTRWDRAVEDALNSCPRMLVIMSPASVRSDNVRDEISFGLRKQKVIIPVLYLDCDLPLRLERHQQIDFRTDYERGMKLLLRTLGVRRLSPIASSPPIEQERQAAKQARLEEQRRQAAERARLEQEREQAAERARLEEERRQAAEQARLEEERKQAAEQARLEEERKQAAEQARLEEERKQAAEQARLEEERKQATDNFLPAAHEWCHVIRQWSDVPWHVMTGMAEIRRLVQSVGGGSAYQSGQCTKAAMLVTQIALHKSDTVDPQFRDQRLQNAVLRLVDAADLKLIEPRRGDRFNSALHAVVGSTPADSHQTRFSVGDVVRRGLQDRNGKVVRKAELKVQD